MVFCIFKNQEKYFWEKFQKSIFGFAKNHVTLILNFGINLHENHVTYF